MLPIMLGLISTYEMKISTEFGDFSYEVNDEGITITKYHETGDIVEVEIPSSIEGKAVTKIGEEAFYGCNSLKSITIPDSVISIGLGAFSYCGILEEIIIPDSVKNIGQKAFSQCKALTNITLPNNIKKIESKIFSNCIKLKSIIIPKGVTSIEGYAFIFCKALESINLPMGLTTIGASVFNHCKELTNINLPIGLNTIGGSAFSDCPKLTSIYIPRNITKSQLENAFEISSLSKIFGYKASEAQKYAIDNNIDFSLVYDVIFDTQDDNENNSIIIAHDNKIIKPEDPVRTDYAFGGWFKDETFENPWDFKSDTITEDTILYAKWTKTHITAPQAQLLKETNEASPFTSMRFISTIESLDFSEVGFVISYSNSNPLIDGDECIKSSTSTAYKKIKAAGDFITTNDLGGGEYIVARSLDDIQKGSFSQDIYVKPYVKFLDGSIHYGNMSIFSVEQCLGDLDYK